MHPLAELREENEASGVPLERIVVRPGSAYEEDDAELVLGKAGGKRSCSKDGNISMSRSWRIVSLYRTARDDIDCDSRQRGRSGGHRHKRQGLLASPRYSSSFPGRCC